MKHYGKKYRAALEKIGDTKKVFPLLEGVALLLETSTTTFDASAELHLKTGCNPKHADQIVRSTIVLPHGTGKTVRIAVFCEEPQVEKAKAAGADLAGGEEFIEEVAKGTVDFDIAIATPGMMKLLAKVAKVLGPKGLMPSPKSGTVTDNVTGAISDLKKGKIEFRTDKQGIIHSSFGKVSFGTTKLVENLKALVKAVSDAKPTGVKGTYLQSATVATTMGPGIKINFSEAV
ncbi:MAG: 50S ribosomal protein L1 [Candidatus Peregrinibacteria bacterium]